MPSIEFSWSHPNPEGLTFCLYEDGQKVVGDIGEMRFNLLMDDKPQKKYEFYATSVDDATKLESLPSNRVAIDFFAPSAPTGFAASLIG